MGWRERDYSQASWRGSYSGGRMRLPPPVTTILLIAHVVFFIALLIVRAETGPEIDSWVRLGGTESVPGISVNGEPAQLAAPLRASAVAMHAIATTRGWTLAFVLCTLWVLAGPLEARCGGRRLLAYYALGTVFSGLAYFTAATLFPETSVLPLEYPVGAFAAWCVASWTVFADDFLIIFGKVTTRAKIIAICALVSIGLGLLSGGSGAGAWLAAVGGGAVAAQLVTSWNSRRSSPRRLRIVRERGEHSTPKRVPVRVGMSQIGGCEPDEIPAGAIDIDDLLAKISREGFASLTPDERERLEAARRAMLNEAASSAQKSR